MDSEAKVEIETTETVGEIGEGGDVELQVPDMPDLNMADILEEAALSTQGEEEGSFDAKAEKRKRLKAARVDRFNLEYVPDIQLPDDMLGEEEDAPEPETEPEPQPQRYVPEEPRDIYAEDELEAAQLLETASESTILSGASYDDNAVQRKSDFLRAFEIPSFSDISSEQSLTTSVFKESPSARESRLSRHSRHRSTKGSKILQRQSQGPGSKPAADDDDEGSSFEEESSSSLVIEIDSADLALDKFQAEKPAAVAIDTAAIEIFEFLDQEGDKSDQKRVSELARIKYRQELETIVGDFVDTLLTEIVTKWETELAGWQYKRRFDQEKLYADLQASVDSYMMESQKNTYLNAKLVEYNKRLKNSRSYEPLIPKIAKIERERYHRALYQLDHHKQRAAMAKKQNSYLVASVLMDFMHVENLTMDVDEHLENTIVQTFSQQSEGFKRYIDREVRRMQLTRYEISDVRLSLITRKHTLGVITEKIHTLEHINDDIEMNDFIAVQNQVASLFKKIEERSNDLKKARLSHTMDVHLTQHNREKVQSLTYQLTEAQARLFNIQRKQQSLRKQLYDAKLERTSLRKQIKKVKFKGGLLSMPNMMHDYDATKEKVKLKRVIVTDLRDQVKRLNERILEHETRLAEGL